MKTMKHLCLAATALLMASCADTDIPGFSTEKPESLNAIEALNAYDVLKSYVDRDKYPSFKLGGATAASDFNAKGIRYVLDKENFDELVTGNAFKYSSVVANDGSMDFSTVTAFVDNATEAGLSVYGHTLCWHSQQNITYLKSIITDPNAANYLLHASVPEAKVNPWDWELHYNLSKPLAVGTEYTIKMRTKATGDCEMAFWPGDGSSTQYLPALKAGTEWGVTSVTFTANIPINVLRFCFGKFGGELYIDDVSLTAKGSTDNLVANADFTEEDITGWTKPSWHNYTYKREKDADQSASGSFTEQDIRDTLTYALDNWVKGMMQACDGRVKGWDVVNEPMSDAVPTELKTAGRDGDAKTNFYWQDYLGKDYVRTVVKLARQYGPQDMKLFVNDYNLEAAYNSNAKLQGLIDMIKYWESDGVTKIDGIGSQMHVTYSMNPQAQQRNEEAYVNHLKMMVATGKLVRISELDMGIQDAQGEIILTKDVTPEQQELMAGYYKFIVSKYLELVPAAQQYGITQWSIQDSPEGSGWLAGQPVGLWDSQYNRKPAYAAFADALSGK
jgi:GH35 family endo-1,4-beta-xylanase